MTGAPHYPQGSGDGYAFSLLNRVEKLEAQNARLLDMLTKLVGYVDDTGLLVADDNAEATVEQVRAAIAKEKRP